MLEHLLYAIYSCPQIIYKIKIELDISTSNQKWLAYPEFGKSMLIW